jgi:CRISPR-associated protein Cmr1
MNTREIKATFEIVTPMFLGDGDQEARIIRPQSFKAELLFWWRALHYAGYVDRAERDKSDPLKLLYEDEKLLFGGTDGQAAFLLQVKFNNHARRDAGQVLLTNGRTEARSVASGKPEWTHPEAVKVGTRYLGFGVLQTFTKKERADVTYDAANVKFCAGELIRSCIAPGSTFSLRLIFRPRFFTSGDGVRNDRTVLVLGLISALKIMGLLGGLGSRKRRGFGSIAMIGMVLRGLEAEPFDVPKNRIAYLAMLTSLIGVRTCSGRDFPLSAFANETDVCVWKNDEPSPIQALEVIGREFLQFRGWGKNGQAAGSPRRENFKADHDWFKGRPAARVSNAIPERAIFGLPHNYFSPPNTKLDVEVAGGGRRASPLLFHIHKLQNNYLPVATFFDNRFLPKSEISIDSGGTEIFDPNPAAIRDFLQGNRRTTTVTGTVNPALFDKVLP